MFGVDKNILKLFFLQTFLFAALLFSLSHTAQAQNADAGDITTGLVGHWKFDETSYTSSLSDSAGSNDGTIVGTLTPIDCVHGLCPSTFNTSNYVSVPNDTAFDSTTFTISFWAKANSVNRYSTLFHKGNAFIIELNNTGSSVRMQISGETNAKNASLDFGDGQWHHIVFTYDGNNIGLYTDGNNRGAQNGGAGSYTPSTNVLKIGSHAYLGRQWNGPIDDVRFYNRVLSADDVALLHNTSVGSHPCDSDHEAVMWFNHEEKVMQYCNGTDWVSVGANNPCQTSSCGDNPNERVVFTTSTTQGAGLNAPSLCQTLADNAGLHGTYLAWYSTSSADDPESTFERSSQSYVLVDGTKIADNWSDLTDGTLDHQINIYENGDSYTGFSISTRTATDGTYITPDYNTGTGYTTGATWTEGHGTASAATGSRRYCFQQGSVTAYTGCSSPAGKAGELNYNLAEGVMQYCDGENWINAGVKSQEAGADASSLSPSAPSAGLIGHWPLDDTNTTALATVGSNGTLRGGLDGSSDSAAGKIGSALDLDGIDDSIELGNAAEINNIFATGGTFSAWYWIDPTASNFRFFDKNRVGTANQGYFAVDISATFQFSRHFTTSYGSWVTTSTYPTGRWMHLVLTYDASSTANDPIIYFDGVAQPITESDTPSGTVRDDSGHILHVGNRNDLDRALDGMVDDIRIYNRIISPDEVTNLYKSSSLVGHWKLDETTGTTATDSSGNGNNGTVNGTDFDTDSVAGVSGSPAMNFDGGDDNIALSGLSIGPTNTLTLSTWIKLDTRSGADGIIFNRRSPSDTTTSGLNLHHWDGGNQLAYHWNNNSTTYNFNSGLNVPLNEWVFTSVVIEPTQSTIYLGTNTGLSNSVQTISNSAITLDSWFIGRDNYSGRFIDGAIDDVRIYNRALSATEIADLYANTGGGSAPITGCPNVGDTCGDGTLYAGLSPDGNIPMYTTDADSPAATWGPGGNIASMPDCENPWSQTSCDTGAINTQILDQLPATYPAAEFCANLNAHGHNDWYLPSWREAVLLHGVHTATGAPSVSSFNHGAYYWTSSENQHNSAIALRMTGGGQRYTHDKSASRNIRCVRKGFAEIGGACSNPAGAAGEIVYNDDHNIMQYCNGSEWVAMGDGTGSATVIIPDVTAPVWSTAAGSLGTRQANGTAERQAPNITVSATDDSGTVTYSKVSGDAWITVNATSGRIEGTTPGAAATYSITIRATDPSGNFEDRAFTIDVIYDTTVPNWKEPPGDFIYTTANATFSRTADVSDSSGSAPNIAKTSGDAFIIVTNNGGSATISGTAPATPGTYTFTLEATDASSNTASISLNIVVFSSGPVDCPNIGDVCADGSLFIGVRNYGSGDENIFMSAYRNETSTQWKTSDGTDDIATNNDDGKLNEAQLADITLFPAFQACNNLHIDQPTDAHGQNDWYLPSRFEFELIQYSYDTINANTTEGITNNYHWVSEEVDTTSASGEFPGGSQGSRTKTSPSTNNRVRCIRR